jgi:hypothetical protein
MRHLTETVDEGPYYYFGAKVLAGNIFEPDMQRTPICAINAGFSRIFGYPNIAGAYSLFVARIPTVLAGVLLGCYLMVWSKKLYGPAGMLVSLFFFAFCPNTIAHARLVTSDIYGALFTFMAVFHIVSYLEYKKNQDYVFMILACGLAITSKQTALLLAVILPLIVGGYWYQGNRVRTVLGPARLLIALGGIVLILDTAYGYKFFSFRLPHVPFLSFPAHGFLPIPQVFVDTFWLGVKYNTGILPIYSYMLGQYSRQGWWYYFPILFMYKVPIGLLMVLVFHVSLFKAHLKRYFLDEMAIVASAIVLTLFVVFACKVQIGIRYMLPIFPFLFLSIGKLGVYFQEKKLTHKNFIISCCMIFYVWSSMSFFPHFIPYSNELVPRKIDTYKFFADSNLDWNQSDYYLHQYIDRVSIDNNNVYVNPERPMNGLVIVNANSLLGIFLDKEKYAWLRDNFTPIDHVAYNWLVFQTTGLKEYWPDAVNQRDGR